MNALVVRCGAIAAVAAALAACAPASTASSVSPTPVPVPAATVAAAAVALPAPPSGAGIVAVPLPAPGGITPSLTLGAGYPAGTQIVVSAANFGQTSSAERSTAGTLSTCPTIVAFTAYMTNPVPLAAIKGLTVNVAALPIVSGSVYSAAIFDTGATVTSGLPPAPGITGGCLTPPVPLTTIASAPGSLLGGYASFPAFTPAASVGAFISNAYGLQQPGGGVIPANRAFGISVRVGTGS